MEKWWLLVDFLIRMIDNINIMIDFGGYAFWALIVLTILFYLINRCVWRYGFKTGIVAGIEKTLDELVKEGLIYFDEREELKRKKIL
jgi:hypothetical protein